MTRDEVLAKIDDAVRAADVREVRTLLQVFQAFTRSESEPMTEKELTLLIDYHDNQDAMAEAMGVDNVSLYHAKRSAEWTAKLDAIKKREADTLAKMVKP